MALNHTLDLETPDYSWLVLVRLHPQRFCECHAALPLVSFRCWFAPRNPACAIVYSAPNVGGARDTLAQTWRSGDTWIGEQYANREGT